LINICGNKLRSKGKLFVHIIKIFPKYFFLAPFAKKLSEPCGKKPSKTKEKLRIKPNHLIKKTN